MANQTTLFQNYLREFEMPPHELVEDVLAVAYGARRAGALRAHPPEGGSTGYMAPEELEKGRYAGLRGRIVSDFGDGGLNVKGLVKPTSLGNLAPFVCVFRGDPQAIDKINGLYKLAWEAMQAGRVEESLFDATVLESELLGIPDCCTGAYMQEYRERMRQLGELGWDKVLEVGRIINRDNAAVPNDDGEATRIIKTGGLTERRARKQLSAFMGADVEYEPGALDLRDFKRMPSRTFAPYFAFEIYPCSPQCGKAGAAGKGIEDALKGFDKGVSEGYAKSIRVCHAFGVWSGAHPSLNAMLTLSDFMAGLQESSAPYAIKGRRGKVGRNNPCPCGSGVKFKKCCGGH